VKVSQSFTKFVSLRSGYGRDRTLG